MMGFNPTFQVGNLNAKFVVTASIKTGFHFYTRGWGEGEGVLRNR